MSVIYLLRSPTPTLSPALFSPEDATVLTIRLEKALESQRSAPAEVVSCMKDGDLHEGQVLDYDRLVEAISGGGHHILVF